MNIVASDQISEKAQQELSKLGKFTNLSEVPKDELASKLGDTEVLIVRSKTKATKELIDSAPNLKAIIRGGVGLDNIDLEYAKQKNIQVFNTPEAPAPAVAELTIGLMLALLRKIPKADATMKQDDWAKKQLKGSEIHGKTVGVIGFGHIGSKVGTLLRQFGAEVLVCVRHERDSIKEIGAKWVQLDELVKNSDIITLHVPLTDSTRGMLGEEQFAAMKNGVYIVNTARGAVIDEAALCGALESGKVAGAALDVYWEEPPFNSKIIQFNDKLVLTPHISGSTHEAQDRIGEEMMARVKELL